jgi:hypothetical protein
VLQGIADDARPVGTHPVPVEAEWGRGLIQIRHSKRHTEL